MSKQVPKSESFDIVIAAMYKFAKLTDYEQFRQPLLNYCDQWGIKGTLLLAEEGINGTIAGTREGIDGVISYLRADSRLSDIQHKESYAAEMPFLRMKVKLKSEIVSMGVPGVNPNDMVGTYVDSQDWNDLITDPDVLLVDTRNMYEYDIGTFKNAVNPKTSNFREFPQFVKNNLDPLKNKKIAMFCTGGIRCEKATAYMLGQGFEEVYHLKGGILKYLEDTELKDSLWQGECFVFDARVAVDHDLEEGSYDQCYGCRHPITEQDKLSSKFAPGVHCPHCYDTISDDKRMRAAERHKQIQLAKERGEAHLGAVMQHHLKDSIEPSK